jgi:agmatine/peptidylarginine deiminase
MRLKTFTLSLVLLFAVNVSMFAQRVATANDITIEKVIGENLRSADFEETDPPEGDIFSVAEFQPQEGVMVRYPFGIPYTLIAELSAYTKVITLVANTSEEDYVTGQYQSNGVNLDNCEFLHAPTDSYWTRDYGPCFVGYGDNQIGIVDWVYNRPRPNDDEVPVALAEHLGVEWFGMDLVTPGGNYMSDGLVAAAATDLVYEENADISLQDPPLTEDEVDQLMVDYLGVTNHIVTMDPLADYIKHIDCWGKFLDVDKILIGQVPESDPRYDDFEAIADFYANTPSGWGHNYEVYRVYTPGGYPATPYSNSLILNNKVFVAQSGSQWDDEAIATYQEAMPGYEIIGIDYDGWENTDALHCRTHEIADRGMLLIRHMPFYGMEDFQDSYEVNATITAYSGEALYADSLKVYYRFNDSDAYEFVVMENTAGNEFSASIPVPECAGEISYYIHAADESGRSENHPYIGGADPHKFLRDIDPTMTISETEIEMSSPLEGTDDATIIFSNTCGGQLDITFEVTGSNNEWLTISETEASIAYGESFELNLTADSDGLDVGSYAALISIASNDPEYDSEHIVVHFDVLDDFAVENQIAILNGVAPNPFTSVTNFNIDLKKSANVNINIYNLQGQLVRVLTNDFLSTGNHSIEWDGADNKGSRLGEGMYFYTINAERQLTSGKVILK